MSSHKAIQTKNAPAAIGPYSQAAQVGNSLYISGQLGIDPATGQIDKGGIVAETNQALENVEAILTEAHFTLTDVVHVQVFLADIKDFAEMNKVYVSFFTEPFPARAVIEVSQLPKYGKIEIMVTAIK
jgi:2-iminobutanoate/2-iminopropanoate deaminase